MAMIEAFYHYDFIMTYMAEIFSILVKHLLFLLRTPKLDFRFSNSQMFDFLQPRNWNLNDPILTIKSAKNNCLID